MLNKAQGVDWGGEESSAVEEMRAAMESLTRAPGDFATELHQLMRNPDAPAVCSQPARQELGPWMVWLLADFVVRLLEEKKPSFNEMTCLLDVAFMRGYSAGREHESAAAADSADEPNARGSDGSVGTKPGACA